MNTIELENGCESRTGRCVVGGPGYGGPGRRWRRRWWRPGRRRRRKPRRWRWRPCRWRRRGGGYHTPSFSSPRQNFGAPRQSFSARVRISAPRGRDASVSTIDAAEWRGQPPGLCGRQSRRASASGPASPTRPLGTIALTPAIVPTSTTRRESGEPDLCGNRPNIGNNINSINRTNNFVRPTHGNWNRGDWYHGDWHGNWNNAWYYRPLGWWTAGYWAGAALSAIPWSWGYWPYYNPYYAGPIVDGSEPSITRSRSWWPSRPSRRPVARRV